MLCDAAALTEGQRERLALADTAFLATKPDGSVSWPDYPGNNMFNSLGNRTVDPSAALLVPEFESGASVHISGRAELRCNDQRRVVLTPVRVVEVG